MAMVYHTQKHYCEATMERKSFPLWPIGLGLAALLIGISLPRQQQTSLVSVFDAAPTPDVSGVLEHPLVQSVADGIGEVAPPADDTVVPAATPVAANAQVAIYMDSIQRVGSTLQMRGRVMNVGSAPFDISVANFAFVDASGVMYGVEGERSTLAVNASEAFEFTVPVPPSRTLTMTLTLDDASQLVYPILQAEGLSP